MLTRMHTSTPNSGKIIKNLNTPISNVCTRSETSYRKFNATVQFLKLLDLKQIQ